MQNITLICGDAIKSMREIKEDSIDLICCDLPYQITQNKWDIMIPIDEMWSEFNRITKKNGVVVLTATQPFTSKLVISNLANFKYDLIWEKTISSGQLNVRKQQLRNHESILVFAKSPFTYNEQKTEGSPYKINRKVKNGENNYGTQKDSSKENEGYRHAKSVIKVSNPRIKGGHPTQKPIELMEYIIKTYSNKGDLVLDCCMGSGTTGVAAIKNERLFYGIELDANYFKTSKQRITNTYEQTAIK